MVVTVHADEHVTGTASNVVDIEEIDLDDPVPEEEGEVVDDDEGVDISLMIEDLQFTTVVDCMVKTKSQTMCCCQKA